MSEPAPPPPARVLVTGATGYLGQFVVHALHAAGHNVHWTHRGDAAAAPVVAAGPAADAARLPGTAHAHADTAAGLRACIEAVPFDAVVNAAAMSQPAACERDPAAAAAANVPTLLLDALAASPHRASADAALFIHVSTDQVYSGTRAHSVETDAVADFALPPVNAYAATKRAGELEVALRRPHAHCILRPSIICGPQSSPTPVSRTLFIQWLDAALAAEDGCALFVDEWRCPVFVLDLVALIAALVAARAAPPPHRVLNVGGPERLSRAEMGAAVAAARGHPAARVRGVSVASPAGAARAVPSPQDIRCEHPLFCRGNHGTNTLPIIEAIARFRQTKIQYSGQISVIFNF